MSKLSRSEKDRLITIEKTISERFDEADWRRLALFIDADDIITNHPRLLRALGFGDPDYQAASIEVLRRIVARDPNDLNAIEEYLLSQFPEETTYISAKNVGKKITFAPHVFEAPEGSLDDSLVALMIPFAAQFTSVIQAVKNAASSCQLHCQTANDLWSESVIVQEIFNLIVRSKVVIADFTGRNPNVMYEIGIAHTLGKTVIPITQNIGDMPFDIQHHRALVYYANEQGVITLQRDLEAKLEQYRPTSSTGIIESGNDLTDDVPF